MVSISNPSVTVTDVWNYNKRELSNQTELISLINDRLLNNVLGDNFEKFSVGYYLTKGIAQDVIDKTQNRITVNHGVFASYDKSGIANLKQTMYTGGPYELWNSSEVYPNRMFTINEPVYMYSDLIEFTPATEWLFHFEGDFAANDPAYDMAVDIKTLSYVYYGAYRGVKLYSDASDIIISKENRMSNNSFYAAILNGGATRDDTQVTINNVTSCTPKLRIPENGTYTLQGVGIGNISYFGVNLIFPNKTLASLDLLVNGTVAYSLPIPDNAIDIFTGTSFTPVATTTTDTVALRFTPKEGYIASSNGVQNIICSELRNIPTS